MRTTGTANFNDLERRRLVDLANILIPEAHGMPSAGQVDIGGAQLDRVLAARPDLSEPLARALAVVTGTGLDTLLDQLENLQGEDPGAYEALTLSVVGGYYMDPGVRLRLSYDGQVPVEVRPEIIPDYVEEELLEPLLARGPIFRNVPDPEEAS